MCLNEVERQGKANKPATPRKTLRAALGGIHTHDTLRLGERSTNSATTRATQLVGVRIYNTTQQKKTSNHCAMAQYTLTQYVCSTSNFPGMNFAIKVTQHPV